MTLRVSGLWLLCVNRSDVMSRRDVCDVCVCDIWDTSAVGVRAQLVTTDRPVGLNLFLCSKRIRRKHPVHVVEQLHNSAASCWSKRVTMSSDLEDLCFVSRMQPGDIIIMFCFQLMIMLTFRCVCVYFNQLMKLISLPCFSFARHISLLWIKILRERFRWGLIRGTVYSSSSARKHSDQYGGRNTFKANHMYKYFIPVHYPDRPTLVCMFLTGCFSPRKPRGN